MIVKFFQKSRSQTPIKYTFEGVEHLMPYIGRKVMWIFDPRLESEVKKIGILEISEHGYRVKAEKGEELKIGNRVEIYLL